MTDAVYGDPIRFVLFVLKMLIVLLTLVMPPLKAAGGKDSTEF
jgi:hypothetical protein